MQTIKNILNSLSSAYLARKQEKEVRRQRADHYYKGFHARVHESDRRASSRTFH